ncbi:hypothetical protein [Cryobacterium sp.]|jgi:iron(III) transport system permease protein|uniref:hypothetical protein n=1 Tax=Cryobacterium sp. TaxID=1926290 RepID=UPI00262C32FA|nr:hypothetical protein [Cryobacterium sp.]MCU1445184.1 iron transporter permease [Cryobacterium sp.]
MSSSSRATGTGPVVLDRARARLPLNTPRADARRTVAGIDLLRLALWLISAAVVLVPLGAIVVLAFSANHLPLLLSGDILQAGLTAWSPPASLA